MFIFVILHYLDYDETSNCIESLLKQRDKNMRIVVVDNGSPNDSYIQLAEKYENEIFVDIIKNSGKLGFSSGNNFGCSHAVEKYNPDFICCMNNDTYILDVDFSRKIREIYESDNFDLLGPAIYNTNLKIYQNPININIELNNVVSNINYLRRSIFILKTPFFYMHYINSKYKNKKNVQSEQALAGAAIVFAKKYLKRYKNSIFPDLTPFYGEEAFLHYRCKKDALTVIFNDSITVYHNHAVSTKHENHGIRKRWLKSTSLSLDALEVLKEIIENDRQI